MSVMDDQPVQLVIRRQQGEIVAEEPAYGRVWGRTATSLPDDLHTQADRQAQGRLLFDRLISGDAYQAARVAAAQAGQRLLLWIATVDSDLHTLPWELLHDGSTYLALAPESDVLRVHPLTPARGLSVGPPLNMLLTTAPGPACGEATCVEEERTLLSLAETTGGVLKLTTLRHVNANRFYETMLDAQRRRQPFHLWHHVGDADAQGLHLAGGALPWEQLSQVLGSFDDLRVAGFNLGTTADTALLPAWANLPVPLVAGIRRSVNDFAMTGLFRGFYEALALSGLRAAQRAAHEKLAAHDFGDLAWSAFTVIQRSADERLLPAPSVQQAGHYTGTPGGRDQVFISYSHRDTPWMEQLRVHLKPLERAGRVSVWADTDIQPGSDWRQDIDTALARARVAVLMVSPNFLASDFIAENELPPILEAASSAGLQIFWLPVSASVYRSTAIGRYQAAHEPGRPLDMLSPGEVNQVLARLALQIERALNT